jgi:DNA-binding MarR family transcriptional regulator
MPSSAPRLIALPSSRQEPPESEACIPESHRVPSFVVHRLRQVCLGIMAEVVGPEGLTPVEYGAMTTLADEPGLDQGRLALRLGIDKMSASQLAERLERHGYIVRRMDASDRRARLLHLTRKGLALRKRLQPAARAAQNRILAPLAPDEREVLLDLMVRVVEGHQAYARPGHGRRGPQRT